MYIPYRTNLAPLPPEDLLGGVSLDSLLNDEPVGIPNSANLDDLDKLIDSKVEEEKKEPIVTSPKEEAKKEEPKEKEQEKEVQVIEDEKKSEVKTEESKEKETTEDEPVSNFALDLANEVAINLGVELIDENGSPIEITNDRQGLVKAVEVLADIKANEVLDNFLTKHQVVVDFYEHIESGKDPLTFLQKDTTVYANLDYTNEETAVNTITKFYTQKGIEPDVITAIIDKAKADGQLEAKGKAAGTKLDEVTQKEKEETEKAIAAKTQAARLEEEKTLKEIDDVIKTGKLLGHQLPSTEAKSFKEFLSGKDKSGKSIRQEGWAKLTTEQRLALNYLVFTDFKLLKGVSSSKVDAFTEAAKLAKDRQDRTKTEGGQTKETKQPNNKLEISFTELEQILNK
jgi:hypothetical protein